MISGIAVLLRRGSALDHSRLPRKPKLIAIDCVSLHLAAEERHVTLSRGGAVGCGLFGAEGSDTLFATQWRTEQRTDGVEQCRCQLRIEIDRLSCRGREIPRVRERV